MREIKYRQYVDGKFHYWGVGVDGSSFVGPMNGCGVRVDKTPNDQCTGLKDKNGVEIYEGDIVAFLDEFDVIRDSVVEWGDCSFLVKPGVSYELLIDCAGCDDFLVIGNIHQNPELLEK